MARARRQDRPIDEAAFRAFRDQTLYRLVFRASRAETTETLTRLRQRGYNFTLAYTSLLANLDTDGTTISALARRAGVTRQAASQLLTEIEQAGYVTRGPDTRDARAILVRQTPKGRALLNDAIEVVTELEAEYEGLIGGARLASLKKNLTALLEHIDPGGVLGRD